MTDFEIRTKHNEEFEGTIEEVFVKEDLLEELKEISFEKNGLIFGRKLEGCDFAYIIHPGATENESEFDFENGLIIPHRLHNLWDRGFVDFEILDDNRLVIVALKDEEDAEELNGAVSFRPISEGQKEFLIQRKLQRYLKR